jgi:hypothetical protein
VCACVCAPQSKMCVFLVFTLSLFWLTGSEVYLCKLNQLLQTFSCSAVNGDELVRAQYFVHLMSKLGKATNDSLPRSPSPRWSPKSKMEEYVLLLFFHFLFSPHALLPHASLANHRPMNTRCVFVHRVHTHSFWFSFFLAEGPPTRGHTCLCLCRRPSPS